MNKEQDLINAVLKRSRETDGTKKISCTEAFELARQFQAKVIEIGHICNQHDIRIRKCQLGCF